MSDPPQSVRVRTDEGNRHRWRAIQSASDFYEVNRSDAIAYACHDVPALLDAVVDVLEREDLTGHQRKAIAETFDSSVMAIDVDVDEPTVSVEVDR